MGMNRRVYVGPYIRCRTKRKPQKITLWGCLSDVCDLIHKKVKLAQHVKFCPNCGGACGDTEIDGPEVDAIRANRLYYMSGERLAMFNAEYALPALHFFVPNSDWPRSFVSGDADTGEILANASPELIAQEVEWIKTTFAEDIARARELYDSVDEEISVKDVNAVEGVGVTKDEDVSNVEVCWGILGEFC